MKTLDGCKHFQGYAENENDFYKADGLDGHPGHDTGCGYGTPVLSEVSGRVVGVYTPARPASDGFVAVYILTQTALETFEFSIGHLSQVFVKVGDIVKKGDLIGLEGNKGVVYVGDTRITLAMQAAGDRRGSHRHGQKRVVKEVKNRTSGRRYLQNWSGYVRTPTGGYYEWALPDNRMASCVDYMEPLWPRSLSNGMSGYDVQLLQRLLGVQETGYFGVLTFQALNAYQTRHGLAVGPCGPKTREFLNRHYGQLEDPVLPPQEVPQELVETLTKVAEETAALPIPQQEERRSILTTLLKGLGLIQ